MGDPAEGSLPAARVRAIVRRALDEDMPWGDVTTETLVPMTARSRARFTAREEGVVCGLEVAAAVFAQLDPTLAFERFVADGARVFPGDAVAEVSGAARPILSGERTALNLLQRMSGIATATARYVEAVRGTSAAIIDTRKTAPGLRVLDKYAVRCGGGSNHRFSLSDAVLVKDNHLAAISERDVAGALRALRRSIPHTVKIEVEVDRLDQIKAVLDGGADIVLLDNMTPDELAWAVKLVAGRALTEASGRISLESVRTVAHSGVDLISVGALTHSVRALDIGLDFVPEAVKGAVPA